MVSLSLHFTATWMYLWWPILYTYLVLVNYSVYKEHFDCLIFKYTSLSFTFFSISNTSSWLSLYTCDFYGLFSSLTCPLWDYVIDWYFMATCARTSGDLICTRNFTWWRILYSWIILQGLILYTYFPLFDLFSISTTSSRPSFYSSYFMAYFVYLLHLPELIVTYFMATWVLKHGTPFTTQSIFWWPLLYISNFLMA